MDEILLMEDNTYQDIIFNNNQNLNNINQNNGGVVGSLGIYKNTTAPSILKTVGSEDILTHMEGLD